MTQKVSGSGSTVAGCYSIVEIEDCTQYSGAISGADAGTFLENYYVSDTLAGINRQSYSGQAEPSTYKEMLKTQALPEEMRQLTLRFVADGEEIFSTHFSYGASFDAENFRRSRKKRAILPAGITRHLKICTLTRRSRRSTRPIRQASRPPQRARTDVRSCWSRAIIQMTMSSQSRRSR